MSMNVDRNMTDSHSLSVIEGALSAVQDYLQRESLGAMPSVRTPPVNGGLDLAHRVNRVLAQIGMHVSRMAVHEILTKDAFGGYDPIVKSIALDTVLEVQRNPGDFDGVYEALADDASRDVFNWFLSYRTGASLIGRDVEEVFPSPLSQERWMALLSEASRTFRDGSYHLDGLALDSGLGEIVTTFLLRQYELPGIVEVKPGDVILDCGAYRGETALWFGRLVGPTGRVIAFEPVEEHVAALRRNLVLNRDRALAPVDIVGAAVSSRSGPLQFNSTAESSSRADPNGEHTVPAVTLDETVARLRLDHVDFVKMDIEGGEVDALKGARATLKSYAPRLATSVYHRPRDLPDVVAVICQACPDYGYISRTSLRGWQKLSSLHAVRHECLAASDKGTGTSRMIAAHFTWLEPAAYSR
jgi:FkbM family methyltransferase